MIDVATLRAAGLTDAQILRVVEADQAVEREKLATRKEANRIYQQKHRARQQRKNDKSDTGTSSLLPLVALTDSQESKEVVVEGREASDWPSTYRELFWEKYPNKIGKPKALAKLDRLRARGVPWCEIWEGLERYVVKNDDRPWCNPETWINQERWTDQPAKVSGGHGNGKRSLADVADELIARAEERERAAGFKPGNFAIGSPASSKATDR